MSSKTLNLKTYKHHRAKAKQKVRDFGEIKSSPEALRAREDFGFFCEHLTRHSPEPKVQPEHMREWNKHLLTGRSSRALLSIAGPNVDILSPRGSAKSTYLGMLAAWSIGNHATQNRLLQILYISYTVDVARPKSAAIRAIIESKEYREIFPTVLPGKKWSDEYWQIDYEFAGISTVGAEAFTLCCAGLKGGIVSKRSHLIILDDLIKSEQDISNPEIREQMKNNWNRAILPTLFEGGRAICLGTRFRPDDIHTTVFIEKNGWTQIEQKAIINDSEGAEKSYWEGFWSLDYLRGLREADPVGFSFQYQNHIVRNSENSVDPAWIITGDVPLEIERFERLAIGLDLSSKTKERNDFTVAILGGKIGNNFYILDMWRGKVSGNMTKIDHILNMLYGWGALDWDGNRYLPLDTTVHLYAEDTAYQASLGGDFRSYAINQLNLNNLVYRPASAKAEGDKLMRLRSITGLFENQLVTFNSGALLQPVKDELENFGAAGHDDCVDAIAYLLNGLRGARKLDSA